jgi:hypothetical protein
MVIAEPNQIGPIVLDGGSDRVPGLSCLARGELRCLRQDALVLGATSIRPRKDGPDHRNDASAGGRSCRYQVCPAHGPKYAGRSRAAQWIPTTGAIRSCSPALLALWTRASPSFRGERARSANCRSRTRTAAGHWRRRAQSNQLPMRKRQSSARRRVRRPGSEIIAAGKQRTYSSELTAGCPRSRQGLRRHEGRPAPVARWLGAVRCS